MPRFIVKLAEDEYCEWSTVVDAPVTWIMDRKEIVKQFNEKRVARADANVTSLHGKGYSSLDELLLLNRAGQNEEELSLDQIRVRYRKERI